MLRTWIIITYGLYLHDTRYKSNYQGAGAALQAGLATFEATLSATVVTAQASEENDSRTYESCEKFLLNIRLPPCRKDMFLYISIHHNERVCNRKITHFDYVMVISYNVMKPPVSCF